MNKKFYKPAIWSTALVLTAIAAGCGGGSGDSASASGASSTPSARTAPSARTDIEARSIPGSRTAPGVGTGRKGLGQGPAPVPLGMAGNFAILAQSAITNVPSSAVTGDVGLSPGTGAGIGLSCAQVTGVMFSVDAAGPLPCTLMKPAKLTAAIGDKGIAYNNAAGRAPDYTELGAGNIGGLNLGPATYKWSSSVLIPTNVTLTGGPYDVWIFQIAQGMTMSTGARIILAGGAQPRNVFWQTFAAADIGTGAVFKGVLMSHTSIAIKTGATVNGRLMAGTQVTLAQNTVTEPAK